MFLSSHRRAFVWRYSVVQVRPLLLPDAVLCSPTPTGQSIEMHSTENGRRSQRRRPDLNINTTPPRDVVPSTPPARKAMAPTKGSGSKPPVSSRALKMPQPPSSSTTASSQESPFGDSFLDNLTPVDMVNKENNPDFLSDRATKNFRISHDLSLPARQVTRDSLVTNMLLSLDAFSLGQMNTPPTSSAPFDDPPNTTYGSLSMTSRMHSSYNNNNSGHGHSYTYSSDLDGTDDGASRISNFSRGRRSNSSSGFQSSLGRINSMRETTSARGNTMTSSRTIHSRGGKTSKSSSTNSIDAGYAQVLSSQRWAHGIGGRSSSFDYGQRPSLMSSNANGRAWNLEFTDTFLTEDYEAAPTPTVPGGPRRPTMPSASVPPPIPPLEPQPKSPRSERKKSIRSRSGTAGRSAQPKFELPPLVPVELDSAPAPHVGYEKSKEKDPLSSASSGSMTSPAMSGTRDKPGFFRRVFGSTRNLASAFESASSATSAHNSSTSVETQERPNAKPPQHIASQMTSPDSPQLHHSQHHVVQKKSSFFRRRKKSVADPPPVPQPQQQQHQQPPLAPIELPRPVENPHLPRAMDPSVEKLKVLDNPEPSPVSSLRQVMNPYLKGSNPSTPGIPPTPRQERGTVSPEYDVEDREEDRRRKLRGFSPDYEPSPNATIRTVKSHSALNTRSRESMLGNTPPIPSPVVTPIKEMPAPTAARTKLSRDATSFFNDDNSDTEDSKPRLKVTLHGGFPTPPARHLNEKPRDSPSSQRQETEEHDIPQSEASPSLLLQPNVSDEEGRRGSLGLPIQDQQDSTRSSSSTDYPSRSRSSLPSVRVEKAEASDKKSGSPLDEPEVAVGEPTEDDRQKAKRVFDGNEDFIQKDRAASWMGEEGLVRQRTLHAYMELYEFTEKSILSSLREVCGRLVLRAETQQVDRILVAFSKRWIACNPNHGFKAFDVIHTMCYSIMLLNTDLHLADIEHKMTRSQFVKNTMTTIQQALADSAPDAFERPSILPDKNILLSPAESEARVSADQQQKKDWRTSFIPPRSESRLGDHEEFEGCGPLVKAPFNGPMRAWECQVENVLKDIYVSIRDERLPLFGAPLEQQGQQQQQQSGLSVFTGMLKRSPSVLSKAPSESPSTARGRIEGTGRPNPGRWASKSRSRPRLGGNGFSSSRTSFDDGNSMWSPTISSATWSRYSLGRTGTSMSVDSLGSAYPRGDYQQSIGFANALSQAIIREDNAFASSQSLTEDETLNGSAMMEDESLELAGPPWVKEGIVIHKHHLDGMDKKAKDRNWTEVFAVIQKGSMSLFSFSSKSMRVKARHARKLAPGGVVGGGNWQDNATSLGTFSLRQTLASALPSPGYSRTRPHVWALSLPTGSVHLFQVGTPEISKEFVLTANYWSARLSTHPLVGGISNIEYGWSDACINNALVNAINETNSIPPRPGSAAAGRTSSMHSNNHGRTHSRQSSLRSSFDMGTSSTRTKLPGDRIHIAEWTPPAQSLRPSNLSEPEQLDVLLNYVRSIEEDLQKHNQLRSPMLLAFTPRGANAGKAMANWERKSSYLLREIVKYRTYVDCLRVASERRAEVYGEREVAQAAARGHIERDMEDDCLRIE